MINAAGGPVHFSVPFRRGTDGKVVCDAQDTAAHVMSQVNVVVSYPVGYRPEKPAFGIPWPLGQSVPINGDAIQSAVEQQVPNCNAPWQEYTGASVVDRILEIDVETP
jgi:hypothetical protein